MLKNLLLLAVLLVNLLRTSTVQACDSFDNKSECINGDLIHISFIGEAKYHNTFLTFKTVNLSIARGEVKSVYIQFVENSKYGKPYRPSKLFITYRNDGELILDSANDGRRYKNLGYIAQFHPDWFNENGMTYFNVKSKEDSFVVLRGVQLRIKAN